MVNTHMFSRPIVCPNVHVELLMFRRPTAERFAFNFRPAKDHHSSPDAFGQQQQPKSQYLNYAGRPIYKNYRKYPYYG